MRKRPDAALEVVLEQRRRALEQVQLVLAERERLAAAEAQRLALAEARRAAATAHLAREQTARPGQLVDVAALEALETWQGQCEAAVAARSARLLAARSHAELARGDVVAAHRQVRALELVLAGRAATRAEQLRRGETRLADEVAARFHSAGGGQAQRR